MVARWGGCRTPPARRPSSSGARPRALGVNKRQALSLAACWWSRQTGVPAARAWLHVLPTAGQLCFRARQGICHCLGGVLQPYSLHYTLSITTTPGHDTRAPVCRRAPDLC